MRPEIVVESSDLDLLLGFLDARTPVAGQWECAIGFFESTGQIGNTLVFLVETQGGRSSEIPSRCTCLSNIS